jgi:hypothetical protein
VELEALVNATVRLVGKVGGALPGRKVLTLVQGLARIGVGGDHPPVVVMARF